MDDALATSKSEDGFDVYFMRYFLSILIVAIAISAMAQNGYWQQHVDYNINIDMDTKNHQFTGTQKLVYTNNSPDTLNQVFFHLYYNAFQPGTMMAERTANLPDPDKRMKGKFHDLKVDEIGFQKVKTLTQNGQPLNFDVVGTILQGP